MEKIQNTLKKIYTYNPTNGQNGFILDYYIRILFFLYPLYMATGKVLLIFTDKIFLYHTLTILCAGVFIFLVSKGRAEYKKKIIPLEVCLIILAVLLILNAMVRIFHKDYTFEMECLFWCLIGSYFLVRGFEADYVYYLRLLQASSLILAAGMLEYAFTGQTMIPGLQEMIQTPETFASWIVLVVGVSALLFCFEKRTGWKRFDLTVLFSGFLIVAFLGDLILLSLLFFCFLCIPVLFCPTADLVKRSLILCFGLLFVWINIPLAGMITEVYIAHPYSFEYSVYVELLMCITALFICRHWERLPADREPGSVVMKKMQKWFKEALVCFGFLFLSILLWGGRAGELPDRFGIQFLKDVSSELLQAAADYKGTAFVLLERYGITGLFLWIVLSVMIIRKLVIKWKKSSTDAERMFLAVAFLFFVQSVFYRLQEVSTPIYIVILAFALSVRAPKREMKSSLVQATLSEEECKE